jgi:hypothetical protein
MRVLKILLSVVVLLVGAAQFAMTNGLWNLSPTVIGIVVALATFFSSLGLQPITISDRLSRALGGLSGLIAVVMGAHAQAVSKATNWHPWVWAFIGAAGIICGVLGRMPLPPKPAPPALKPDEPA